MDERLLTIEQVARRWAVPPRHVRERVRLQELPAIRIGRLLRFEASDVEAYERRRRSPAAATD